VEVRMRPDKSRVYFQRLSPDLVTDFDLDERGFIEWIRIDVPRCERQSDGKLREFIHVTVWSKADQNYRRWEWDREKGLLPDPDDLSRLGEPVEEAPLSQFGIDFVPIVHAPFRAVDDDDRGEAAVWPVIEKLDEANKIATRLHQMLYRHNKPLWALVGTGRSQANAGSTPRASFGGRNTGDAVNVGGVVTLGDDATLELPPDWDIKPIVADLNYQAHLAALQAMQEEIGRDLPEESYYELRSLANESGVALRYKLMPATDRLLEGRANIEAMLARANAMGLTLLREAGLIQDVGSFDAGDFEHEFEPRDVIPLSGLEEGQEEQQRATAFTTATGQTLPMTEALQRIYGYPEKEAVALTNTAAATLEAEDDGEQ
jgi:hypothetical protein